MIRFLIIVFCVFVIIVTGNCKAFAQATGTASSSATIVSPIAVGNSTDLVFGNIPVNSSTGTVAMAATAATTITSTGGTSLSTATAVTTAAAVNVTGSATYGYSVNVEPSTIAISDGHGNSVSLAPQLSANAGTLDKDGKGVVYMGGTLTISGNQQNGLYENNGGISITFNYN